MNHRIIEHTAVYAAKIHGAWRRRQSFLKLLANGEAFRRLEKGENALSIIASWQKSLEEFEKRRARYLLY